MTLVLSSCDAQRAPKVQLRSIWAVFFLLPFNTFFHLVCASASGTQKNRELWIWWKAVEMDLDPASTPRLLAT